MTPIDELCKGLDERGVKYDATSYDNAVFWGDAEYELYEVGYTRLIVNGATPAQAIAATVGEEHEMHICKRCGVAYELNIIDKGFGKSRFCPNCGHKELYQ